MKWGLFLFLFSLIEIATCQLKQVKFDVDSFEEAETTDVAKQYFEASDNSLLWGAYRSGLYFGLRPRLPRSLLSGLMWFNVDAYDGIGKMRHFYEQGDDMRKANWISYDPRFGGCMCVSDNECHINIYIDFVKSKDGKSWGVKVRAKPYDGFEHVRTSFVWYSGLERESQEISPAEAAESKGILRLDGVKEPFGYKGNLILAGMSEDLGIFSLKISQGPSTNKHPKPKVSIPELDSSKLHHLSLRVPDDNVWKAKDIFMTLLMDSIQELEVKYGGVENISPDQAFVLRDLQEFEGNLHFVQQIFEGECEFEVTLENYETPDEDKITFDNIDIKIEQVLNKNEKKFNETFQLNNPFKGDLYYKFAKEGIFGLLGGLSYFYGDQLVDRETILEDSFEELNLKGSLEGPYELFSFVPSRPFFPRGFYWDEGFHLLPILNYDSDLVLEVLHSWFHLIDENGWIAREQILGPELRSRVPEEFQVQSPSIVNPPTLMLVFSELLQSISDKQGISIDLDSSLAKNSSIMVDSLGTCVINNPTILDHYARKIYPKLKSHYEMFRRTQGGLIEEFGRGDNPEGYRWRGRTLTHCLASGLDDYPRPLPADIAELNVDLLSWMGVMTRSMKIIARILGFEEDFRKYNKTQGLIEENLIKLHWSDTLKTFCDLTVDDNDENMHVCHRGYVSLFPFLTKLLSPSDTMRLECLIKLISDPSELWSDYGIRSLSKKDKYYGTGDNYWKSPIWVNMNTLVLQSLEYYKTQSSPYLSDELSALMTDTYQKLRNNVVTNMVREWERTGFVWEQYDDETGMAKGAKNFLGWSSNVVSLMNMPETI